MSDGSITVHGSTSGTVTHGNGRGASSGSNSNGGETEATVTQFAIRNSTVKDTELVRLLVEDLIKYEGLMRTIYTDSVGNPTTGVGFLISSPEQARDMGFVWSKTYTGHSSVMHGFEKASLNDVTKAIDNAKQIGESDLSYSKKLDAWNSNGPKLQYSSIGSVLASLINQNYSQVKQQFPAFDSYPRSARLSILDINFNVGSTKLKNQFVHFSDAVKRQDWNTAAAESHRPQVSDERNNATAQQLRNANNG